jgi:hypothetical protein
MRSLSAAQLGDSKRSLEMPSCLGTYRWMTRAEHETEFRGVQDRLLWVSRKCKLSDEYVPERNGVIFELRAAAERLKRLSACCGPATT